MKELYLKKYQTGCEIKWNFFITKRYPTKHNDQEN